MPLHLPRLHQRTNSSTESGPDAYVPSSSSRRGPEHRDSVMSSSGLSSKSSASDSASQPQSILRRPISSSKDSTPTSPNAISKRLSTSLNFDRTDTASPAFPDSDDEYQNSTPATSVSSLGAQCPLPSSNSAHRFPFFTLSLSSSSTLSFIALPLFLRPVVLDAVQRAWRRGVSKVTQVEYNSELMKKHKDKGCEGGVWEVTLKGDVWMPSGSEKVA